MWDGKNSTTLEVTTSPYSWRPTVTETTTFTATSVTDAAGCPGVVSGDATITVGTTCDLPTSTIGGLSSEYFSSQAGNAKVEHKEGQTYQWTITNGVITEGANDSAIAFKLSCTGPVTLTVTVTNSCGESFSTATVPVVRPWATIKPEYAGPYTYIEGGTAVTLRTDVKVYRPRVTWSDGIISSSTARTESYIERTAAPSASTIYTLTDVRDEYGCPGDVSGQVTVNVCHKPPATITAPAAVLSSETHTASVPATSGASYVWSIANGVILSGSGTSAISFRASCASAGPVSLSVTVTAGCGAVQTGSVSIPVNVPAATVTGSATIAQGGSTTIQVALAGAGPWKVQWADLPDIISVTTSPHRRTVTPAGTTTFTVTSATTTAGATECPLAVSGSAVVTVKPPIPTGFNATATALNQIRLVWSFSGSADRFDVYRDGVVVGTSTTNEYIDGTVAASTSYVYAVAAVKAGTSSALSTADLATTFLFDNDPLVATQTEIRAVHVTQLRTAINIVRARAGLAAAVFTDSSLSGLEPKVVHITEMRTALNEARSKLAVPAIVYVHPTLTAGNIIYSAEVGELRGGVK